MDKIRKREFSGSVVFFTLLTFSVIGIPAAIVYLIDSTVETEYEVDDAEAFWKHHKERHSLFGRLTRGRSN